MRVLHRLFLRRTFAGRHFRSQRKTQKRALRTFALLRHPFATNPVVCISVVRLFLVSFLKGSDAIMHLWECGRLHLASVFLVTDDGVQLSCLLLGWDLDVFAAAAGERQATQWYGMMFYLH